ncbi:sensor histidine kinase [Evansella halocellulosilytica]|uniref:sensor histidine kinase n=1 Tax=Evansella halocellulosilytica TaxID=2011013 RepID=UPI0015CB0CDF|nr:HAMP domain-containing sensor histidine kinase [Evansella halocellulosilytica]
MSIKRKLLASNLGMIIIPIIAFFMIEIGLALLLFRFFNLESNTDNTALFISIRFILIILVIAVTNTILTYYVYRQIIKPIQDLMKAAEKMKAGDFESEVRVHRQDELGKLSEVFNDMRKEVKASQELQASYHNYRRELISNLTHDLKTPITSIKGYVEGIRDGVANTPEKLDKYTEVIFQKTNELDHLINELSLYNKLETNEHPMNLEPVNIKQFLTETTDDINADLEMRNIHTYLETNELPDTFVQADKIQLKRVIFNIIENSVKHFHLDEKNIWIRAVKKVDSVEIKIQDNGPGIEQDDLPFIFDRFYRADEARNSASGGSGLGLAIVKQIIESHHGTVRAESQPGIGTTIIFSLPIEHKE